MHARRQTILLTGFGPFPGIPANASAELVNRMTQVAPSRITGFKVHSAVLPTLWRDGPRMLVELLEKMQPVLTLHFGVSSRTDGFAIEMRCRNQCSASPDAAGLNPPDACVLHNGPPSLASTLPVHHIVARLRRLGLPARISHDPGAYLCNTLLYHSLLHASRSVRPVRAGFIHIPDALLASRGGVTRRSRSACRLTLDQAVEGALEIVAASLGRAAGDVDSGRAVVANPARAC